MKLKYGTFVYLVNGRETGTKRAVTMESDISKLHKGTDGFYYEDYIAPDKPETFVGKLVSTEWWHKGVRFALICNFQAEDGRRIALFAFQKHTGFTGRETVRSISNMWRRIPSGSVKSGKPGRNAVPG